MGTLCGMGSLSAGHYSIILRSTNSSLLPFFSQQSILRAYRYATNYYCCRYWNFYFGGKLLANWNGKTSYFLVPQSISTYWAYRKLHFEGVMLFFCLGMYLLQQNKWQLSALLIAFSISVKLLPLLLLPLFLKNLGWKRLFLLYYCYWSYSVAFSPFLSKN
jgi:hypothetical protein